MIYLEIDLFAVHENVQTRNILVKAKGSSLREILLPHTF